MILVSIIIVNYNTKNLLKNCISSIYNLTQNTNFEIIVVDNASVDDSEKMIKDSFQEVVFIQSGANIGFGRANNLGIQKAKGEFVFFLNSDTILINDAIGILANYIVNNSTVAVCGANLYDINEKPAISFSQNMPGLFTDLDYFFGGLFSRLYYKNNVIFNYSNLPLPINGYISGANMMVRKSILENVGFFDPDFFMYYEETELTWRIKNTGAKIVSVPEARIIHLEGASEIIKENSIRRSNKSKYLYYEKTNQKYYINLSYYIFFLVALSRIVFFYLMKNQMKHKYWLNLLQWTKEDHVIYKKAKINNF
jgi:GT2 family glycosyltransferase